MNMNKAEINYDELIKSQKNTKPIIEDIVGLFLEGDKLKNALDFIAFLRENNMNPRWHSANSWRVTGKKSKGICRIDLGGNKHAWHSHFTIGDWQISDLEGLERKYLEPYIADDKISAFVWENVKPCRKCCTCGPRWRSYAGKEFTDCCGFVIVNPGPKELEIAQILVQANKAHIYANA